MYTGTSSYLFNSKFTSFLLTTQNRNHATLANRAGAELKTP
jgi:hypothetical protein